LHTRITLKADAMKLHRDEERGHSQSRQRTRKPETNKEDIVF